jgi:hypothetical protein
MINKVETKYPMINEFRAKDESSSSHPLLTKRPESNSSYFRKQLNKVYAD